MRRYLALLILAAIPFAAVQSLPTAPSTAQEPTPAPVVQPFVVDLEGPSGTIDGPFEVAVTKPVNALLRWKNKIPDGAKIREMTDNNGQTVLICLRPPVGAYRLHLLAQLPNKEGDGLDPFAEDEIEFVVGPVVPPAPPVVVDPVDPPTDPAESNESLNKLTALLRANPSVADSMRGFYAVMAAEVRNDTANGLKTVGDLRTWQVNKERATFTGTPATKIVGVAAAIGGYLDAELGLVDIRLDHAKAAAAFERLSAACGRAAK